MCISIQDTKLQTGWGVEDVDRHTVRGVGREGVSVTLTLTVIVTRASPCPYDGVTYYTVFKACSEFFRSRPKEFLGRHLKNSVTTLRIGRDLKNS